MVIKAPNATVETDNIVDGTGPGIIWLGRLETT